ncbi:MAG: hypothetical protein C4290_10225 [Chloroflexota bacterium]
MAVRVVALPSGDAVPEAVRPTVALLKRLAPSLVWQGLPFGKEGLARYGREGFTRLVQEAIGRSQSTLFGAGSGKTPGTTYLRWTKDTYASVHPERWCPGLRSPLRRPEGFDYLIVRENDVYVGVEGPLVDLAPLASRWSRDDHPIDTAMPGAYTVKRITEAETVRLARFAGRLALSRKRGGWARHSDLRRQVQRATLH